MAEREVAPGFEVARECAAMVACLLIPQSATDALRMLRTMEHDEIRDVAEAAILDAIDRLGENFARVDS